MGLLRDSVSPYDQDPSALVPPSGWMVSALPLRTRAPAALVSRAGSPPGPRVTPTCAEHPQMPVRPAGGTVTAEASMCPGPTCQSLVPVSPQVPAPHSLPCCPHGQLLPLGLPQAPPTSSPPFLPGDLGRATVPSQRHRSEGRAARPQSCHRPGLGHRAGAGPSSVNWGQSFSSGGWGWAKRALQGPPHRSEVRPGRRYLLKAPR